MSGFLLLIAMGAVMAYAMPAMADWKAKFWCGFTAVFLAPFSWPWLVARGHRYRKAAKVEKATAAERERAAVLADSIAWWRQEADTARAQGDGPRLQIAVETLAAMGAEYRHAVFYLPPVSRPAACTHQYGTTRICNGAGSLVGEYCSRCGEYLEFGPQMNMKPNG